jgi:ADP-ribose pyrophosphatase
VLEVFRGLLFSFLSLFTPYDLWVTERKTIYEGRVVKLSIENNKWEIIEHKPAVAILALEHGKMLLVKQYRPAIGDFALEIPAGLIEPGEEPEFAAARELSEECNLGGDLELLTSFYSSPGFTDEKVFPAIGTPDDDEEIETVWLEPQKLLDGARDGTIKTAGPAVAAAFYALGLIGSSSGNT